MVWLCAAGWFSLNVPSGLTLYWFVNNIISTAMQIYMKRTINVDMPPLAAAGEGPGPIIDVTSEVIKPKEERKKEVSMPHSSSGSYGAGGALQHTPLHSPLHAAAPVHTCLNPTTLLLQLVLSWPAIL